MYRRQLLLTTLIIFTIIECINYLVHLGGWSLFNIENYEHLRNIIYFGDVDRMLTTSKYSKFANAYLEYLVIGAIFIPILIGIWFAGLQKMAAKKDTNSRYIFASATILLVLSIATHFTSANSTFFGGRWPFSGSSYPVATFAFSILRLATVGLLLALFVNFKTQLFSANIEEKDK